MANLSKRGFASMDSGKQREIASKGGRAAHTKGTAHEFTSEEAQVAGRKGGEAVSRDRQHMSAIGREGGHSRGNRARTTGDLPEAGAVANQRATAGPSVTIAQGGSAMELERPADDGRPDFSTHDRERDNQ